MRLVSFVLATACLVMSACSSPAADEPAIEVSDAYIVEAPAGRDITAGGFTLRVTGGPLYLAGVSSDMAERVELHTMSMEGGMMQMRRVEGFDVGPGAPLVLERGGNHLMLFGLSSELAAGGTSELVLTLTDESGAEITFPATAEIVPLGD